ncbi:ankyrin repeat domain-containing protein 50 [Nephila pilipes]|uniref:Ankyrin repeat domain-containing protein 50 n=1 Tax=Nephila pilipes TaxID=299642 RepID=A0A8X6TZ69_NEPPI|nr:ankyrin repeat domain-containing protein 50 [Nephila pilipes]
MKYSVQLALDDIGAYYSNSEVVNMFYISAYFTEDKSICGHIFLGLFPNSEEIFSALHILHKHQLAEFTPGMMFTVSTSIQSQTRDLLKEQKKEKIILTIAVGLVNYLLTSDEGCPRCLNHATSVLKHASIDAELVKASIGLPGRVAMRLATENGLDETLSFCDSILCILGRSVGESHEATLDLQYDLSALLARKGQHAEAIAVLQSLHETHSKYSGKDEAVLILVTEAKKLYDLSKYEEALQLYRAIFGERKVSETTNKIVLLAWRSYAFLLRDLGEHSEAIQVLKEVIQHGTENSKFGASEILFMKSSIAHVHVKQKEYEEALELFREVFLEMKDYLGENHPDTRSAKLDIGVVLDKNGNCEEASEIFKSLVNPAPQTYN